MDNMSDGNEESHKAIFLTNYLRTSKQSISHKSLVVMKMTTLIFNKQFQFQQYYYD